jgi:nucleoside-diphosphate-sugar epimerase
MSPEPTTTTSINGDHRAMRIVITGGLGMLGTELARHIRSTRPDDELLLLDMPAALAPPDDLAGALVLRGDIRDGALLAEALASPEVAVVHLASIVSGGAERDFDAALEVNLDGGRALVEACRAHATAPRLVFTSSLAVFGGELALGPVDDDTRPTPSTTYGATKAMLELLFADATRKGFLDARSARPPTIIVRPGAPNAAASSFASAVVREPLAGRPTTLPVGLDTPAVVIGVDTTVACLARLLEIEGAQLGDGRVLNLPGLLVTPLELLEALYELVDETTLAQVSVEIDPATEAIVRTWATDWRSTRADELGLPRDEDADGIVRAYLARIGR